MWDNPLRKFWQDRNKDGGEYVKPGGYRAGRRLRDGIFLDRHGGDGRANGKVIAVDIQDKMLEILKKRAAESGGSAG